EIINHVSNAILILEMNFCVYFINKRMLKHLKYNVKIGEHLDFFVNALNQNNINKGSNVDFGY
ncbi:MAG: hypothetical protein WCG27_11095, partial [Pseudomonadota bacterium]